MRTVFYIAIAAAFIMLSSACNRKNQDKISTNDTLMMKLNDFASFTLTSDIGKLTGKERKMITVFMEAADIMDELFWLEAYGDKDALLDNIQDEALKRLVMINYGPWERLNGNLPFVHGAGPKPSGANFYPADMTLAEFEQFSHPKKADLYTLIRRNEQGELMVVPYHAAFHEKVVRVSDLLKQAAELAEDKGLKRYLELRSAAFLNDDYLASDMAWMDMKTNTLDFVLGPIETYEDQMFGYKAAHEAYVLIKDTAWSNKLAHFAALLPALQKGLPVDDKYKTEMPGDNSDLGAYDVVYYAGDCNAGSKTIAINLPNDERVQLAKGSRRLQLKNAMQAKFDKILIPIAVELTPGDQIQHITFDAFFTNTMFHEVAHGLGCSRTIDGKGSVREALKEHYTTIEEGKADILGLYLETRLKEMGEIDIDLMDSYATFLAGIFRSIRFGASSAHGKANLIRFNYFRETGAFAVDSTGKYRVNFDKMQEAVISLTNLILTIQGDGDYDKAARMIQQYGVIDDELKAALKRIEDRDIPVDIVFVQGRDVLGL